MKRRNLRLKELMRNEKNEQKKVKDKHIVLTLIEEIMDFQKSKDQPKEKLG